MAANLRVGYNNASDKSDAVVTASTTAGSLVANNMLTDIKSVVWRSTGTSATITIAWTNAYLVGLIALAYTNFTSSATMRVRLYSDAGITLLYDSGTNNCCQYAPFGLWNWGMMPLGVNAYSFGAYAHAVQWAPINAVKEIKIDIVDSTNPFGYLEVGRLITSNYWEPTVNMQYGAQTSLTDASTQVRTDAGDLMTDIGSRSKTIQFNLQNMSATDRTAFLGILQSSGLPTPLFVSLFPQSADPVLEQENQIYCKFTQMSPISASFVNAYSSNINFEEI